MILGRSAPRQFNRGVPRGYSLHSGGAYVSSVSCGVVHYIRYLGRSRGAYVWLGTFGAVRLIWGDAKRSSGTLGVTRFVRGESRGHCVD